MGKNNEKKKKDNGKEFTIRYEYEIRPLNGEEEEGVEVLVPEFDLPQSIAYIIAMKMRKQNIWGNMNRDGTLVKSLAASEKALPPILEFSHGKMTIEFELVQKFVRVKKIQCPHCGEWLEERDNYSGLYYIKGIWHGRHEYTEQYKNGGNMSETRRLERIEEHTKNNISEPQCEMEYHV